MRFLMLMIGLATTTLVGCGTAPHTTAKLTTSTTQPTQVKIETMPKMQSATKPMQTKAVDFAAQAYPNQQLQCSRQISASRGTIRWSSATTADPISTTLKYYNRKTGIAKRRTKADEHLWAVVNRTRAKNRAKFQQSQRSFSVMSLAKAQALQLLCHTPTPPDANTAIIVSTFTPKPLPKPDYAHAAP